MKRPLLALLAATTLLVSACSLLQAEEETTTSASVAPTPSQGGRPVPDGLPAVYGQVVTWTNCGAFDCASIDVPLDWSEPDGPTIAIAVSKRPANNPGERIGSLLINPGGPGGSGLELLEYFPDTAGARLLDSYDVIGFDPRGVGESNPVNCGDARALDAFYVRDFQVETQADLNMLRERNIAFAENCRDLTGPLFENVDTVSAARDMDVIRYVLGDDALHFLGFSYGTQLGATYAEIYPENVGRVVLDGAVDFLLPGEEQSLQQAKGFENALTNFLTWCLEQSNCPLDGPVDNARAQIGQIARSALETPYPSAGNQMVNGNTMVYGIVVTLYAEESWPYLLQALEEVAQYNTAGIFGYLADFYLDRNSETGEYEGNSMPAFTAVSCLDAPPDEEEWDIAKQRDFARDVEAVSPTFGWWFSGAGSCEGWPFEAHEVVTSLDNAKTAAPMLVVGTIHDPATPYSWAESLSAYLDATLLTYDGDGHTAYGRSNQCVIDAVDSYLVDGTLPAEGTRC